MWFEGFSNQIVQVLGDLSEKYMGIEENKSLNSHKKLIPFETVQGFV